MSIKNWLANFKKLRQDQIEDYAKNIKKDQELKKNLFNFLDTKSKHDDLNPIINQLYNFYRNPNEDLQHFSLEFLPLLLIKYLNSLSSPHLSSSAIETFILALYNIDAARSNEENSALFSPSLSFISFPSVYHEPLPIPNTNPLDKSCTVSSTPQHQASPHPLLYHSPQNQKLLGQNPSFCVTNTQSFSNTNRLSIISHCLYKYNQNLCQYSSTSHKYILKLCLLFEHKEIRKSSEKNLNNDNKNNNDNKHNRKNIKKKKSKKKKKLIARFLGSDISNYNTNPLPPPPPLPIINPIPAPLHYFRKSEEIYFYEDFDSLASAHLLSFRLPLPSFRHSTIPANDELFSHFLKTIYFLMYNGHLKDSLRSLRSLHTRASFDLMPISMLMIRSILHHLEQEQHQKSQNEVESRPSIQQMMVSSKKIKVENEEEEEEEEDEEEEEEEDEESVFFEAKDFCKKTDMSKLDISVHTTTRPKVHRESRGAITNANFKTQVLPEDIEVKEPNKPNNNNKISEIFSTGAQVATISSVTMSTDDPQSQQHGFPKTVRQKSVISKVFHKNKKEDSPAEKKNLNQINEESYNDNMTTTAKGTETMEQLDSKPHHHHHMTNFPNLSLSIKNFKNPFKSEPSPNTSLNNTVSLEIGEKTKGSSKTTFKKTPELLRHDTISIEPYFKDDEEDKNIEMVDLIESLKNFDNLQLENKRRIKKLKLKKPVKFKKSKNVNILSLASSTSSPKQSSSLSSCPVRGSTSNKSSTNQGFNDFNEMNEEEENEYGNEDEEDEDEGEEREYHENDEKEEGSLNNTFYSSYSNAHHPLPLHHHHHHHQKTHFIRQSSNFYNPDLFDHPNVSDIRTSLDVSLNDFKTSSPKPGLVTVTTAILTGPSNMEQISSNINLFTSTKSDDIPRPIKNNDSNNNNNNNKNND